MREYHVSKELKRTLFAVDYMRRNPDLTITQLAREFKCSRPTIYRYKKFSQEFYGDYVI